MKTGVILEGGGLRSLFVAGVLDAWMQADIRFDGIIGVSGGALFGCNFKSHQMGRAIRYNVQLKDDPRYMGIRSLIRTGDIVGADFAYHVVPTEIDVFDNETFMKDPAKFYVVATDIETGEPYYRELTSFDYEGLEWMRATASMPLVSNPVHLEGRTFLDGGMTDSLPLKAFQDMGYERNVVILTRPRGYRKEPSKFVPLFKLFCRKYPKIAECMQRRHEAYNQQLDYLYEQEKAGNAILIFPEPELNIGRIELDEPKMRRVYGQGIEQGNATMQQIKDFIGL